MNLHVQRTFGVRLVLSASVLCFTTLMAQQGLAAPTTTAQSIISLVRDQKPSAPDVTPAGEASFANPPENFYAFPSVRAGEVANIEKLTLHFAAATKLTKIESTKDFRVEQGGSCVAERAFSKDETCTLLVRFAPQGAGRRLGKITIAHTASAETFNLGLGGYGAVPVISFTPALVSLVPGTDPSGTGLLTSALSLAVDGGDSLYIADTGNGIIRYIDSSGAIKSLATGFTSPTGIAVDNFGEVYFDEPSQNLIYEIYDYGPVVQASGTATGGCPVSAPCILSSHAISAPAEMSIDRYNNLFWVDGDEGAALSTVQPPPASLIYLYDPFPYQQNPSAAMAVDAGDNIYSLWANGGECEIVEASLYDAENIQVAFTKVAGGHTCGYAGDGGQAGNAEINAKIGQISFDIAGNLYFSDTLNQRVRRIDATTGILNTIAGNGSTGSAGNGGPATSLHLTNPTGVAVDSQGQVYIISGLSTATTSQLIWKLGPNGMLSFASQLKGSASAAQLVTVANTGNSEMTLTKVVITGADPGDFAIDGNTTNCFLTAGSTLGAGQSCKIGIIFTPAASGTRTANLVMLDNSVNGSNTVQLVGTGTVPSSNFTLTSPASESTYESGKAVTFKASVTSPNSPVPTGKVSFLLDGVAISGSPVKIASGAAQVTLTASAPGSHTLSASYSGDANYAPAGPLKETYSVSAAAAKVTLKASANPTKVCSAVSFTATVTADGGTKPTGEVELMDGSTLLGTASLKSGKVDIKTTALAPGTSMLTAKYGGDDAHEASSSVELKEVVKGSSKPNPCSTEK